MNFALSIPLEHVFVLAVALFCVGLTGVLVRRNVMFVLMSLEVMMNACGLAFVAAGARWAQADGQIMFMFILALAAAEVAVALGEQHRVDLPIATQMHAVLKGRLGVETAVQELMLRRQRAEFDSL